MFSALSNNYVDISYTHVADMKPIDESTAVDIESLSSPTSISLKPPLKIEHHKSFDDDYYFSNKPVSKKSNIAPIKATVYSVADLQMATDSFNLDNLVGEGTFGRVYRAQFNDRKVCYISLCRSCYVFQKVHEKIT